VSYVCVGAQSRFRGEGNVFSAVRRVCFTHDLEFQVHESVFNCMALSLVPVQMSAVLSF
jgi:hypothetical protein